MFIASSSWLRVVRLCLLDAFPFCALVSSLWLLVWAWLRSIHFGLSPLSIVYAMSHCIVHVMLFALCMPYCCLHAHVICMLVLHCIVTSIFVPCMFACLSCIALRCMLEALCVCHACFAFMFGIGVSSNTGNEGVSDLKWWNVPQFPVADTLDNIWWNFRL